MRPIAIEDFARLTYLSSPSFSPDGSAACFVATTADLKANSYASNLWVRKDSALRQLTSGGKERSFAWADGRTVLFIGDREGKGKDPTLESRVYSIAIDGGEATLALTLPIPAERVFPLPGGDLLVLCSTAPGYEDLYKGDEKLAARCLKERKENEDYETVTQNPWWWNGTTFTRGGYSTLYLWSAKSRKLTPITPWGMDASDVQLSQDGKAVYYSLLDVTVPVPKHFAGSTVWRTDIAALRSEKVAESREGFVIQGFVPGSACLYILAADGSHGMNTDADFYALAEGEAEPRLVAKYGEAIGSSVGSDVRYGGGRSIKAIGDTLYFVSTRWDEARLYRLEGGSVEEITETSGSVDSFDVSPSGEILAVALYGMRPQELYDGTGRRLSSFNVKALQGRYIAEPVPCNTVNDGHEVHGFVLRPYGFEKGKKYPVILDIHGGPKTVYGPVFYHEMQYWASHGYFVIFCNPTGSDGRGAFMDIRGQYGETDFADIMAFCDAALAAWPEMDAENLFETGGSYGGFMTNWIIGHTDRFRACASQRSISNWFSMCGVSDIGYDFTQDQTAGNIWNDPEPLWRQSPLRYADRAKTPTLFIHSFEDYRCPIDQGYQMFAALLRNGVESKMVCFRGENHELSRSGLPKHRLKRLQEITSWFDSHRG